jgi:hypothetical protein
MATKSEQFPSRWLKAADIDELGPQTVTIASSAMESVGSGARAERKVVLHFRGDALKPLIVGSVVNWDALVAVTGAEDSDDWAGHAIELYGVDVLGPQGPTRGIRIRKPKPAAAAKKHVPAAPAPEHDDTAVGF